MTDSATPTPPAGWHKHPTTGKQTWWDGTAWTDQVKPKKRVSMTVFWITAAAALVFGVIVGSAGSGGANAALEESEERIAQLEAQLEQWKSRDDALTEAESALEDREAEVAAREEAVGAVEAEIAANTIPGSGIYLVGVDIQPGTYRSVDNSGCYWARLSGLGGSLDEIRANANVDGQAVVEIRSNDVAFETSRCTDWVKVG